LESRLEPESGFYLGVNELLLDKLEGGERSFELVTFESIGTRASDAVFEGAHDTPGDSVAESGSMSIDGEKYKGDGPRVREKREASLGRKEIFTEHYSNS
jgi:hypothetical protein